jgi:hypothetical protein
MSPAVVLNIVIVVVVIIIARWITLKGVSGLGNASVPWCLSHQ